MVTAEVSIPPPPPTAVDVTPAATAQASTSAPAAAPRKRRRRAAASGATEDCSTCRKGSLQCDRKRPYCSQCVEAGRECPGYRTTLTWGVGVASRGKLRGMTCPVAGKSIPQSSPIEIKSEGRPHKRKSSSASSGSTGSSEHGSLGRSAPGQSSFSFSASLPTVQESRPIKIEQSHQTMAPPPLRLDIPSVPVWFQHQHQFSAAPSMPAMHPHTPFASPSPYDVGHTGHHFMISPGHESAFPQSARSTAAFSEAGFMSPRDFPPTPLSYSYTENLSSFPYGSADMVRGPQSLDANMIGIDPLTVPVSGSPPFRIESPPSMSHGSVDHNAHELLAGVNAAAIDPEIENYIGAAPQIIDLSPIAEEFPHFEMNLDEIIGPQPISNPAVTDKPESSTETAMTLTRGVFNNQFFHLSSRMQSLLDFYDKHICSVLVAFDDDANPYRTHILSLAAHNQGLQNAIAALATNNIRMRSQERLRSPDFVQQIEEDGPLALSESSLALTEASPEEQCYKALSINQLNMQLAFPGSAEDDSVLATLLILCLFHVCDSGFSKFKTQLAGVQKLLALRKDAPSSSFTAWVQMFFTWFDVMTSTVNDRETEIDNSSLGMLDYSTDLGALEQFSGCDGKLFKLIARLGRLNLLAQQRPVRNPDGTYSQFSSTFHKPASRYGTRSLNPEDYCHFDGNGWGAPLDDFVDDGFGIPQSASIYPDGRTEFWVDWHDVRSRLQSWSMDYSSIPGPQHSITSSSASLSPEQRDLVHINESFRAAALLYTERLGNPHMPSSNPNLQHFVAQGLFHITAISTTSCVNKFLLWPLFIIGTETVSPSHRATIRSRCVGIQRESGFFNNLSVLQVLERAWSGNDDMSNEDVEVDDRQPFKWRRAMSKADGEYIVV